MNLTIQIIGMASAVLTTASFVPQVIKTWKSGSTSDLSPMMFSLFCIGVLGWLIYGLLTNDLPIILANSVTICLAGTIMFFIIRNKNSYSISHFALFVDNLDIMTKFYCSVFEGKAGSIYRNPLKKFSSCFITFSSGDKLELMHIDDDKKNIDNKNWGHIAISCGSKKRVNKLTEHLLYNSMVKIISKPRVTGDGYYESTILDPENNIVEITI